MAIKRGIPLVGLLAACSDYKLTQFQAQDIFTQEPAGEVDVLLVVDNSCSMQPYQDKLGENFGEFLTYLEEGQADYHIGVLTTTVEVPPAYPEYGCSQADVDKIPEGGNLVGGTIITKDTENADTVFSRLVNVGTCGNGNEMGLHSAWLALTPPLSTEENFAFLRGSAMLSIIFVTDEQDTSPFPTSDYINAFREVKGLDDRSAVNADGLVVKSTSDCNAEQIASGATRGSRYLDVIDEMNGMAGNICADDFADILTDLSLRTSRLRDTFYLTKLPDPATLVVTVDDREVGCETGEWTYELQGEGADQVGAIVFERASMPPPNSLVTATYDYGSGDPAGFCPGGGR